MKIFETNCSLGYLEVAYFIETKEKEYLCIFENQDDCSDKVYKVGELAKFTSKDLKYELIEIPESKHETILKQSSLYGTYLFDKFLKEL